MRNFAFLGFMKFIAKRNAIAEDNAYRGIRSVTGRQFRASLWFLWDAFGNLRYVWNNAKRNVINVNYVTEL